MEAVSYEGKYCCTDFEFKCWRVADAIDFCKNLKINGFENSEATTEFI